MTLAMKEELIAKFETLLQTEDITAIKLEVRELHGSYRSETAKEKQLQTEKWDAEEHEEGEEFEFVPNELDTKFEEFYSAYKERVKEHGRLIAEAQKENLDKKKALIEQLEALIKEEENIGKAFSVFNEIRDNWSAIGNVPGDKYKDVQDTYHRLREDFYYNINIYKELKENDLHINEKKKQELIDKAKGLAEVKEFKELDMLVRSYQKAWFDVGPSTRENYQALADEFFGYCRAAIDRIKAYYEEIHGKQEENLAQKVALVEELKKVNSLELKHHSSWTKKTTEVLEMQKKWKSIGYAKKKENEDVWQEFRGLCDLFFEKKKSFYESRHDEQSSHQTKKEDLVKKAKELSKSEEWKKATEAIISLQKDWKNIGPAPRKFENKLWAQFRAACDHFFQAKKEFYATLDDRQGENLVEKVKVIEEVEGYEMTGKKDADLAALRGFSAKWNEVGHIPKASLQDTHDRYHKALDAKYDQLDLGRVEKSMMSYKERINGLRNSDDSGRAVNRERGLLRDKIERLKSRVLQYENNLEFFTGDGAASMKKDYEKKIKSAKREIDEIKEKLRLFNE
jgi:hypothetical protein